MKLRSNLSPAQRKVVNDLKADDSIIICTADKGNVVVVKSGGGDGKQKRGNRVQVTSSYY